MIDDFLRALTLLTVFHFPLRGGIDRAPARALVYFPVVGLFLGAILGTANFLLRLLLPSLAAGTLVIALWAGLTGGLHLDGFADACDALFAAVSRERRLEILRDVHLGTFGAVGLVLLLLSKVSSAADLSGFQPFLIAPVLARWAMVYAARYPLARREGMAVIFRTGLTWREQLAATVLAALMAAPFLTFGLVAIVVAFLTATMIARVAISRLGGLTGDIYGMIGESVELAVLLVGAARVGL